MRSIGQLLLIGAIATAFVAASTVASEAAKKRKKVAAAKPAACLVGTLCSTNCAGGWCQNHVCAADGKRHVAVFTPWCPQGLCPQKC